MPSHRPSNADVIRGTCHAAPARRPNRERPLKEILNRGVWRENPVLVQALGLCPALAVTNTVANSIAMATATFFVLTSSSVMVSSLRRVIPEEVRISAYVMIIATFVTAVEMVMQATVPEIHKALGAYVFLIVVNCMILSRQEAFASRQPVLASLVDAAGTGIGFFIALLLMGSVRELLGSGSLLGVPLAGEAFEPWVIMALPPGGFFTIGFLLLGLNAWKERATLRAAPRSRVRRWPHPVSATGERVA